MKVPELSRRVVHVAERAEAAEALAIERRHPHEGGGQLRALSPVVPRPERLERLLECRQRTQDLRPHRRVAVEAHLEVTSSNWQVLSGSTAVSSKAVVE